MYNNQNQGVPPINGQALNQYFQNPVYQDPRFNQQYGYFQSQPMVSQQQIPSNYVRAKTINSPDEIMPGDIPMDGSVSFFIMNDHSAIFGKYWDKSGTLQPIKFVREQNMSAPSDSNDISERLSKIESQLAILTRNLERNHYKKGGTKYERRNSYEQASASQSSDG